MKRAVVFDDSDEDADAAKKARVDGDRKVCLAYLGWWAWSNVWAVPSRLR
jgi:hypothetical protein